MAESTASSSLATSYIECRSGLQRQTNPPVFLVSGIVATVLVLWGVFALANLGHLANAAMAWTTTYFGWWHVLAATGLLIFVVILSLCTRRLGGGGGSRVGTRL